MFSDGRFGRRHTTRELDGFPLPDLLSPASDEIPDTERLTHLLDLAFLGRASAGELNRELDALPVGDSPWQAQHFANDLFLTELVKTHRVISVAGQDFNAHGPFLERVLAAPTGDVETIRFRQAILRELDNDPRLVEAFEELLSRLYRLLTLLHASRDDARLEPIRFRFEVLGAIRSVVRQLAEAFTRTTSGLRRLHDAGTRIVETKAFARLEALIDHHEKMATLKLEAFVGADGRLRHLEIKGLHEAKKNPYYRRPLRRWWDRLRIFYRRYNLDSEEVTERLTMGVWQEIVPSVVRLIQLICHLEVYLFARTFAAESRSRGLEVCLPTDQGGADLDLTALFNPLLLPLMDRPVPTDLRLGPEKTIHLVTGPNSGGKTRLLQAVGIAQVFAHCGLYVPCARATLPQVKALFASIVEFDRADQQEGRLGTELVRLRNLFESVPPKSLVLLDELCSGTNPSEAIEIVDIVLRLLRQIEPYALVTTHFLDFAVQLQRQSSADGLGFLQAEVDTRRGATYRFIPGVATTSLAVGTAERLGVTFEELEQILEQLMIGKGERSEHIDDLAAGNHDE